jgi:hypothetical protein
VRYFRNNAGAIVCCAAARTASCDACNDDDAHSTSLK